jgi:hypothetical protein
MEILLKNVRLAFPQLFEAKTVNGEGEPAFSASFLMEPNHSAVAAINDAVDAIGKEKWAAKWAGIKKELAAKDKLPLHDGDLKSRYSGFEGMVYVSARSKVRQPVIDRDKSPLTASDGKPYAGCWVNAKITLWAQDNNYGKRINASLGAVQFLKDGEAFAGGGVSSTDDFEDLGVEEEEALV